MQIDGRSVEFLDARPVFHTFGVAGRPRRSANGRTWEVNATGPEGFPRETAKGSRRRRPAHLLEPFTQHVGAKQIPFLRPQFF